MCALLYEKGVSRVKKMTQHRGERCGGTDQEGVGGGRTGNVSSSHGGESLYHGNLAGLLSHPQGIS